MRARTHTKVGPALDHTSHQILTPISTLNMSNNSGFHHLILNFTNLQNCATHGDYRIVEDIVPH